MIVLLVLYTFIYKTPTKQKSIVDTFVFKEIKPTSSLQNDDFDSTTLDRKLDGNVDFLQFPASTNHTSTRPLPHPRSHVITNSSHVILQFVSQFGCKLNKKHGIVYQYLKVVIVCYELSYNNTDLKKCSGWVWDPANWTLSLSTKQEKDNIFNQYRICTYPKLTDRVGKIVYENGTVDYPGCSFNKSPCSVVEPYFDVTLNMRINWSPCCRKMMITMLSNAHDIFEKHRIRYVMTGGAVISVGRENGSLIPYDTDLDLIVDIRDREMFANQSARDMAALGKIIVIKFILICSTNDHLIYVC